MSHRQRWITTTAATAADQGECQRGRGEARHADTRKQHGSPFGELAHLERRDMGRRERHGFASPGMHGLGKVAHGKRTHTPPVGICHRG